MGLKKYLFPLFLLLFVFSAVQYIRPAVVAVNGKVALKKTTQDKLHATEMTVKNIGSLSSGLAGNAGVNAVYSFLPSSIDHDRVVDKLNYVAVHDGVTISNLTFSENAGAPAPTPAGVPAPGSVLSTDALAISLVPPTASPETYSVSVSMNGSYESMKKFLHDVSALDRMSVVTGFSIDAKTGTEGAVPDPHAPANGDFLGTLKLDFTYLPKTTYANAYLFPMFATGSIDTKTSDALLAKLGSIQLAPDQDPAGRANPFKH